MAAVTLYASGSSVATSNDTDRSVTVTTATDDLIVVVVAMTGQTALNLLVVSDDDGGTYTRITGADSLKATSADAMGMFVRTARVASGKSTIITVDVTTNSVTHTGCVLAAHKVTGMSRAGSGAVKQSAKQDNQTGGGTPTPVLGAAALTSNALIGAVFNATNPAGLTPRTSWSETLDSGYATPTTGIEIMSRDSGETATSIAWGSTSASAFCSSVVELDASAPDVTVALTGRSVTAARGSVLATNAEVLSGSALSVARGTVTASTAFNVALTGQAASAARGTVVASVDYSAALSGQSIITSSGTAVSSLSSILSGQSVSLVGGTITASIDFSTALTGQFTSLSQGTITASTAFGAVVTGENAAIARGITLATSSVGLTAPLAAS